MFGCIDNYPIPPNHKFVERPDEDFDGDGFTEIEGDVYPDGTSADRDDTVYPNAPEICDEKDNDLNGEIDDDPNLQTEFYTDSDQDGFGVEETRYKSCFANSEIDIPFQPNKNDCNDADPSVYPGSLDREEYGCYLDDDKDGFGDATAEYPYDDGKDCDDSNPNINSVAAEVCDGVDNNCNGFTDGINANGELVEVPVDGYLYYVDADDDGYGGNDAVLRSCEEKPPIGLSLNSNDCNDEDESISPGSVELCDEIDQDCNGENRDSYAQDARFWYLDNDNDGYGDDGVFVRSCDPVEGYADNDYDCADGSSVRYPNAPEICNTVDDDCDGIIDEEGASDAPTWYFDNDGDGFAGTAITIQSCTAPTGFFAISADCNDSDVHIKPNTSEVCDGIDNNCDGIIDGEDAIDKSTWFVDADNDGYGSILSVTYACVVPNGYSSDNSDCDDENPLLNRDDNDGDGASTCDGDCDDTDASLNLKDYDNDGFDTCSNDCNDAFSTIHPEMNEECDGIDNNCDDMIDGDDAIDKSIWYPDLDEDGFGAITGQVYSCIQPDGFLSNNTDCDDEDFNQNPNADELCITDEDDNCNGLINEDTATDVILYFQDADNDGYGVEIYSKGACTLPAGYAERQGDSWDCNDNDSLTRPGLTEYCNEKDDDCDGLVDELVDEDLESPAQDTISFFIDEDGDGFGASGSEGTFFACPNDINDFELLIADNDDDCDDTDSEIYPNAPEDCAEIDRNCDGLPDLGAIDQKRWHVDSDGDSYGDEKLFFFTCNEPPGFILSPEHGGPSKYDCNDIDAQAFPQAPEFCNGKLEDCDRVGEEGLILEPWFLDDDEDVLAFYDSVAIGEKPNVVVRYIPSDEWDDDGDRNVECELDVNPIAWSSSQKQKMENGEIVGLLDGLDCDDENARIYRGAALYEPKDACVVDEDEDGWGDYNPSSQYDIGSDCDDSDARFFPGAAIYEAADVCVKDEDEDGYGDIYAQLPFDIGSDCDDSRGYVYPFAPETCNGQHDDCEEQLEIGGIPEDELDNDGDGYVECDRESPVPEWFGEEGFTFIGDDGLTYVYGGDCNDNLDYVYKGAAVNQPNICAQDENGDGEPDCALSSHISNYTCDFGVFFDNGFGVDFVRVENDDLIDPLGKYALHHDFYIMTTEVTQGMFEGLMGYNPSTYLGNYRPVETISWKEAAQFANALSLNQGFEECYTCTENGVCTDAFPMYRCEGYRIPTDSEWELAARSGTKDDFWTGNGTLLGGHVAYESRCGVSYDSFIEDGQSNPLLRDFAWFCSTNNINGFAEGTKDVGQLIPNGFGLYDIHGNVSELSVGKRGCSTSDFHWSHWCLIDRIDINYRGGAYNNTTSIGLDFVRAGISDDSGFRLVRSIFADVDGDGISKVKDCDDNDSTLGAQQIDQDCDGYIQVEDCNDTNPFTALLSNDADCDGIWTQNDCDDANPLLHSIFLDPDCNRIVSETISSGSSHNCGIDMNGTIQCWGDDSYGQISASPNGKFTQVSSGNGNSCAVDNDGKIHCWGYNYNNKSTPPTGLFTQVSVGLNNTCAIDTDGNIQCWGYDAFGQSTDIPSGTFMQVTAGLYHACGIDMNGTIQCWGNNNSGEVSAAPNGSFVQISAGEKYNCGIDTNANLHCWGINNYYQSSPPSGEFVSVSAGNEHSCAIDINGMIHCWGRNNHGQSSAPEGTFIQVSAANVHSCAIDTDGNVQCWGNDGYNAVSDFPTNYVPLGQCDTSLDWDCDTVLSIEDCNDNDVNSTIVRNDYDCDGIEKEDDCNDHNPDLNVATVEDKDCDGVDVSLDCDDNNSMAATTTYDEDCDGVDVSLDCDDQDFRAVSTILDNDCDGFYDDEIISCGVWHCCGIDNSSNIQCWGVSDGGVYDHGQVRDTPSGKFTQVSVGAFNSCALDIEGNIHCWGDDRYDQVTNVPSGIFTQVSSAYYQNCALDIEGNIHCWGFDNFEQMSLIPDGKFQQISSGSEHSCAIDIDGDIHCWGRNNQGQSTPPTGSFINIEVGSIGSCGLDSNQSIQCWGNDSQGQISNVPMGTFMQISYGTWEIFGLDSNGESHYWGTTKIAPDTTFVQASTYFDGKTACGIDLDRNVLCWGSDNFGQSSPPSNFTTWNGAQ